MEAVGGIKLCELSLRIAPGDGKCGQYRKSGSMSCRGCEAWQQAQSISVEEVDVMAKKICAVAGCTKQAQHGTSDMCNAHFSAAQLEASVNPVSASKKKKVGPRYCSVPGCQKQLTRQGLCWGHLKARGIDPKTGKSFLPSAEEQMATPVETPLDGPFTTIDPERQLRTPGGTLCLATGKLTPNADDLGGALAVKLDGGKLDWHSFPLVVLEPLIQVAAAGCDKYARFNCLKPFEDGDVRLFSAALRHASACQLDPLAIDPENGCYHGAAAAWNMLMRTYHAEQARKASL